ncbi:hypothetical protein DFS34DRAFT_698379 [Phlyctochytrium arcticum]|nr:hypothetical protein DFS34DRAFT_698379 [Phlyctochytrium arcticum]
MPPVAAAAATASASLEAAHGDGSSEDSGVRRASATAQETQGSMQAFLGGAFDCQADMLPLYLYANISCNNNHPKWIMGRWISSIAISPREAKMCGGSYDLFESSKACENFLMELNMQSWIHAEEHKRRNLQKSDVVTAASKTDMYDYTFVNQST